MKITDRLIGDHKTFRKMLIDLDKIAGLPPQQQDSQKLIRIAELFKDHLLIHSWCEDRFYYPAVRKGFEKDTGAFTEFYMSRLEQEHRDVDRLMDRLEQEVKTQPLPSGWMATYALFCKQLLYHMHKEEHELFPFSESLLGAARLEEISQDVERHRSEAPAVRVHSR